MIRRANKPPVTRAALCALLISLLAAAPAPALALAAGNRLATIASPDTVAVSGSTVVFSDVSESGNWDVFVGRSGAQPVAITGVGDQTLPDVDGDVVVYVDYAGGDSDIRGYDLVERREFDICNERGDQTHPRISGEWVVWLQLAGGPTGALHAHNIRTGEQLVIADSKAAAARIGGDVVVYEDHEGGVARVVAFDLASRTARVPVQSAEAQVMPATDGEWIAFTLRSGGAYRVVAVSTGSGRQVTVDRPGEQTMPQVDNGVLSFIEKVAGEPLRIVTAPLSGGEPQLVSGFGDVVGFSAGDGELAWIARDAQGQWELSSTHAAPGLIAKVTGAVKAAWRRLSPATYVAWAADGAVADGSRVVQAGYIERPRDLAVTVVDPETIELRWTPPYASSGVRNYAVYTHYRPITARTLESATLLASEVATNSLSVALPTEETTLAAMSRYYAVIAFDSGGSVSPPSASVSPSPHGAAGYTVSGVDACFACHIVHTRSGELTDSPGASAAAGCYSCHGSTGDTSAHGRGAMSDVQAGFGDERVFNRGPVRSDGGSVHRNATMAQSQSVCSSCHDPHRRPYWVDEDGQYVAEKSSAKLLRSHVASQPADAYVNWMDEDPSGNRICFTCHGADLTPITLAGGAAAYVRTAGDHEGSGDRTYADSAHGPATLADDEARIQCLICHNQHGSATSRLVDYRQSGTTDPNANAQANLCFRCHNAQTANSWNSRNVEEEFARASAHPSVTTTDAAAGSATCASCHNTHFVRKGGSTAWDMSRASDPSNTLAAVGSPTDFCLGCHGTEPGLDGSIDIAASAGSSRLVPYAIRMRGTALWPLFGGWSKGAPGLEFTNSAHATAAITDGRAGCNTCHDPHGSDFPGLAAWTRPSLAKIQGGLQGVRANTLPFSDRVSEENLCFQCHGDGSATRGKAPNAPDVYSAMQAEYSHPVERSGQHSSREGLGDHGVGNRHSECGDCHNPHAARSGVHRHGSSAAGQVLRGAVGVKPSYAQGNWAPPTGYAPKQIVPGLGDDYEAYLCFKCHADDTAQAPDTAAGFRTNVVREFNPANFSYHRVMGERQEAMRTTFLVPTVGDVPMSVSWSLPGVMFKDGYAEDTMLTCTSCHGSRQSGQARGPHGSSSKYLLDSEYPVDWNSTGATLLADGAGLPDDLICAKCHNLRDDQGNWGNSVHRRHAGKGDDGGHCRYCHVGVPHGWKRPRLLGYTSDEQPYSTWSMRGGAEGSGDFGLYKLKVRPSVTPTSWRATDCSAKCHSGHPDQISGYWP